MELSVHSCCSQLAAIIPGLAVGFPNTTLYEGLEASYFSLQEGSVSPACVAQPTTSAQVAEILSLRVDDRDCRFAIKSQGHAPAAGFANIEHGVTIDLTGLADVSVNDDLSVASVGAGASWLDVYSFLDPLNRTVAGGRNGQVGVGGLTLGGGISYFSPQAGWTCDTVANFEVVLASGQVVDANASSHADLFRALKGGTNNFGIVTRVEFETLPIGEILGGFVVNDVEERHAVFKAFTNVADAPEYDVHASIVLSVAFNSSTKAWTVLSVPIYTLPVQDPPVYRELFDIPHVSNTMHLTKLSTLSDEPPIVQTNQLFFTATYGVSLEFMDRMFDIFNSSVYGFDVPGSVQWSIAFEPLPTVFVAHGAGENSLGTSPRDGNEFLILFGASWPETIQKETIHAKASKILEKIDAAAKSMGLLRDLRYANYADASQKPFDSYGQRNKAFLQKVARKYDPSGLFQTSVPGGFKLKSN